MGDDPPCDAEAIEAAFLARHPPQPAPDLGTALRPAEGTAAWRALQSPERLEGDRISAVRRVFAAEAARAREDGLAPSAALYMQTQCAILLCDVLEAAQRQAEATELLCDELREARLSRK